MYVPTSPARISADNRPLAHPLTRADRDHLVGYLRLMDGLLAFQNIETARRLLSGTIIALENR